MENIRQYMQSVSKKTIYIYPSYNEYDCIDCGCSKFGGVPDVPDGFIWPVYCGEGYDGETKERPLAFLLQINCKDIAAYDTENIYPHSGVLSFFYEMCSTCGGNDPNHKGSSRVYYFEDSSALSPATAPDEISDEYIYKQAAASVLLNDDYPDPIIIRNLSPDEHNIYDKEYFRFFIDKIPNNMSKLGGYAMYIQNFDLEEECELVSRGIYTGNGKYEITDEIRKASEDWTMLFQLNTIAPLGLEIGPNAGSLYWYIRKQELAQKNFKNTWTIFQTS